MYTTLEMIKKHLNIHPQFTDDDNYLLSLYEVAATTVSRHICSELVDLEVEGKLPAPLLQAILLYIGDLYNSREGNAYGVSVNQIPFSYDYLLSLYKNYSDADTSNWYYVDSVIEEIIPHIVIDETGHLIINVPEEMLYGKDSLLVQRIISNFVLNNHGYLIVE